MGFARPPPHPRQGRPAAVCAGDDAQYRTGRAPSQMAPGEQVVEDYRHLNLSLKAHPLSFLRSVFARENILRQRGSAEIASGRNVAVAGLVLVRQHPGSAKSIFMTLEDETGIANIIVWPRKFEEYRPVVMGSRLISVSGLLQNEKGVIHIVADHFEDLTPLLLRLSADGDHIDATAPVDEIKRPVISRRRRSACGRYVGDDAEGEARVGGSRCRPAHRQGDAEGPEFSLTVPNSERVMVPGQRRTARAASHPGQTQELHVPGFSTSAAQSHIACTPTVTSSTWQWWKPPSSLVNTLQRLVLRADGRRSSVCAVGSGICSSPAPCSSRNGQRMFCRMPSSRKPSSSLRAASRLGDAEHPHAGARAAPRATAPCRRRAGRGGASTCRNSPIARPRRCRRRSAAPATRRAARSSRRG